MSSPPASQNRVVVLRDLTEQDSAMLRAWRNQPDVARYMYTDHHISQAEHDRWFAQALIDPRRRHWLINYFGRAVGLVALSDINEQHRRASVAIYIAEHSLRGRGVGAIAHFEIAERSFGELPVDKLCCEALATNQAAIAGYRTFGFQQEGYLRQHIIKRGVALDVVLMSLLRKDWIDIRDALAARIARIEARLRRSGRQQDFIDTGPDEVDCLASAGATENSLTAGAR